MQRCVSAMQKPNLACEDADQLGRDLYELNRQAVQCRYPQDAPDEVPGAVIPDGWKWRVTSVLHNGHGIPEDRATACDWLKALHCLSYQCSEGDVPESPLYQQIDRRIRQIEAHLACSLPEYDAAPWD